MYEPTISLREQKFNMNEEKAQASNNWTEHTTFLPKQKWNLCFVQGEKNNHKNGMVIKLKWNKWSSTIINVQI